MSPYWKNRLAEPDQRDEIVQLVRAVPGERYENADVDYWKWRYFSDTPFAADVILSQKDELLIGTQPVSFFDWQWGDANLKGAMYTGVLTHPDHRRRGVFRSLIDSSNDLSAKRGAQFCMTLPNDESLPGFLKFGDWKYPGVIPMWVKVIDGTRLLASKLGPVAPVFGWLPKIFFAQRRQPGTDVPAMSVEQVSEIPSQLDDIADVFARDINCLMIRRSAAYWQWRYSGPLSNYHNILAFKNRRLAGAVVTVTKPRFGMEMGLIVDLVADGGLPTMRALIRAAEDDIRSRGMGIVTCQLTSPLMQQALRAEGYVLPRGRLMPKKFHFVYRLTGNAGLPHEPSHIEDWHLTFGDSDNV